MSADELDAALSYLPGSPKERWHLVELLFARFEGVPVPHRLLRADLEAFLEFAKADELAAARELVTNGRLKRLLASATDEEKEALARLTGNRSEQPKLTREEEERDDNELLEWHPGNPHFSRSCTAEMAAKLKEEMEKVLIPAILKMDLSTPLESTGFYGARL